MAEAVLPALPVLLAAAEETKAMMVEAEATEEPKAMMVEAEAAEATEATKAMAIRLAIKVRKLSPS